ncbi:DUF6376 family protein [Ornithinibacillus bavariensis]|uniref:Lipoprotein n=1 Tax=Ornithinibacillus bavariensis TaxID=545502 RepID=A0A919X7D3_9BACI|nr:DUF6376 family protein [Ornithinibacillus bavariensis]GIO25565.1 hypothetical protein J43TS3_01760 [Ornithinibacillus bavariensis]
MKKTLGLLLLSTIILLTGCGIIEETRKTIHYATETTDFINELSAFSVEVQSIMNNGEVNVTSIEEKLLDIENTIAEFNSIEAPAIAEGIHNEILIQNEKLLDTINKIQSGELMIEDLNKTDFTQSIDNITKFMDQIQNLENN